VCCRQTYTFLLNTVCMQYIVTMWHVERSDILVSICVLYFEDTLLI